MGTGDDFFRSTRYVRGKIPGHGLDFSTKPADFKVYSNPKASIALAERAPFKTTGFQAILEQRRSRRSFAREPITLPELATVLAYTTGLSRPAQETPRGPFLRHVPSAGNLHPHETHVIANAVEGLEPGLYHYNVPRNTLDMLAAGDFRSAVAAACLDQAMAARCGAVLAWTACVPRSKWKYLQRCYRYVYMDLGHVGQNFYLVAEALDLAACTIGAIYDDEFDTLLGVDGKDEATSYIGVLGRRER